MHKKIAIFSLGYLPTIGGAEMAVYEITKRIENIDFTCLTYRFDNNWPQREKKENVDIIRLGRGTDGEQPEKSYTKGLIFYIFQSWRAAEKEYKKNKFDAIWAMMASYAGAGALIFKILHPKVPLVLTLQEGDTEEYTLNKVGLLYPLWKLLFKKADHIQVISNFLKDFARKHGATCPIEVIPNGVDLNLIDKINSKPNEKNQDPLIISTSRLVVKNGIDVLIEAVNKVRVKFPQIKCMIIGDGPDKKELQELIKKFNAEKNIFLLGQKNFEQALTHVRSADIFIRPSRSEGLGNSFLEAMALGVPIIGTLEGGIKDFLFNKETGLACKTEDADDLAEQINLLLTDQELKQKITISGEKLVRKKYNWDLIANKMNNIFNDLNYGR